MPSADVPGAGASSSAGRKDCRPVGAPGGAAALGRRIPPRIREMGLCRPGKARTVFLGRPHSGAWATRHDREEQCRARTRPAGPATSRPALRAAARRAARGVSQRVLVPRRLPRRSCRLTTASSRQAVPDIAGAAFFLVRECTRSGCISRAVFLFSPPSARICRAPAVKSTAFVVQRTRRRSTEAETGVRLPPRAPGRSRPVCSTLRSTSARSSADRAPASGAGRRGFESSRAHLVAPAGAAS